MSQLKIWGRLSSVNVKKAVWAAQELGLDFEHHEAGGVHGVVKTPAYIALNPNSQIPVMEDGDYVLWESNVITRYLCAKIWCPHACRFAYYAGRAHARGAFSSRCPNPRKRAWSRSAQP